MTVVRIRSLDELDAVREQLHGSVDYGEIKLELQRRQDPPNDQWCVGCSPVGDGSNETCAGCGPIYVDVADATMYFSFGYSHRHEVGGQTLDKDTIVRITAPDPRAVMFRVFGAKWSFPYDDRPTHPLMRDLPVFDVSIADDGFVTVESA